MGTSNDQWPALPLEAWRDTFATLHRWTQIVGKVRAARTPWINHSWHVTLYVTARGLTTSVIPYGPRSFEITFDFIEHHLVIQVADGEQDRFPLRPQAVAEFYDELLHRLNRLDLPVTIHGRPNELEDATPFSADRLHHAYDPEYAARWWRVLVQVHRVLEVFRARFIGKCSPIQFFWGSFDLAVTRFSGRTAPQHPGGIPNCPDWVVRDAYSHEVSSCGFWPGGGPHPFPLFYGYAYPEPDGFASAPVGPDGAFYSTELREWVLPYEAVRMAEDPDDALLTFLQGTYEAAAELGRWDRWRLDRYADPRPA